MNNLKSKILQKVFGAIDSDDPLEIALSVESNYSEEQIFKLLKIVKLELLEENKTSEQKLHLKQFLNYIG